MEEGGIVRDIALVKLLFNRSIVAPRCARFLWRTLPAADKRRPAAVDRVHWRDQLFRALAGTDQLPRPMTNYQSTMRTKRQHQRNGYWFGMLRTEVENCS